MKRFGIEILDISRCGERSPPPMWRKNQYIPDVARLYHSRGVKRDGQKVWLNGDGQIDGEFIDVRTEIALKRLLREMQK